MIVLIKMIVLNDTMLLNRLILYNNIFYEIKQLYWIESNEL